MTRGLGCLLPGLLSSLALHADRSCQRWLAQGYHGDTSAMFPCGSISKQAQQLCDTTKEALDAAIAICRPGQQTKRIGAACAAVADRNK